MTKDSDQVKNSSNSSSRNMIPEAPLENRQLQERRGTSVGNCHMSSTSGLPQQKFDKGGTSQQPTETDFTRLRESTPEEINKLRTGQIICGGETNGNKQQISNSQSKENGTVRNSQTENNVCVNSSNKRDTSTRFAPDTSEQNDSCATSRISNPLTTNKLESTPEKKENIKIKAGTKRKRDTIEDDEGSPPQKNKKRCYACNCKLELAQRQIGQCRCDFVFCSLHRLPEQHNCIFDHKEDGRREAREKMVKPVRHLGTSFRRLDSDS